MAAVTITVSSRPSRGVPGVAGRVVGPTTHPRRRRSVTTHAGERTPRRVSRAVYVRRRLSVAVLAVGLVLVTAQAGAALGGSSPEAPGRAPTAESVDTAVSTVVRPGDSLWSLAQRLAPDDDPRVVVDELRDARHGRPLLVGETVRWDA
jgi:hypothetical protein